MSSQLQVIWEQNQRLQQLIQSYFQSISQQKCQNSRYQSQIQHLLQSNQRLLNIIYTDVIHKKQNGSLMPISQKSQRQSDLMNPLNSLIKTKKTINARSQRGNRSINQGYVMRLQAMGKNLQHSQFVRTDFDDDSFLMSNQNKSLYKPGIVQSQRKYSDLSTRIEKQLTNQLKSFYNCAQKNKLFYDAKINQLKDLSNKIVVNKPYDKFDQIAQKVQMSPATAILVKKAMARGLKK